MAAKRALRHCWNHVEPHRNHAISMEVWGRIHVIIVGTAWNHMGSTLFLAFGLGETSMCQRCGIVGTTLNHTGTT